MKLCRSTRYPTVFHRCMPKVAAHNDDQAYQYTNWSGAENCEELEFNNILSSLPTVPIANESEFDATANFAIHTRY